MTAASCYHEAECSRANAAMERMKGRLLEVEGWLRIADRWEEQARAEETRPLRQLLQRLATIAAREPQPGELQALVREFTPPTIGDEFTEIATGHKHRWDGQRWVRK